MDMVQFDGLCAAGRATGFFTSFRLTIRGSTTTHEGRGDFLVVTAGLRAAAIESSAQSKGDCGQAGTLPQIQGGAGRSMFAAAGAACRIGRPATHTGPVAVALFCSTRSGIDPDNAGRPTKYPKYTKRTGPTEHAEYTETGGKEARG
jgi:hypothetical protein